MAKKELIKQKGCKEFDTKFGVGSAKKFISYVKSGYTLKEVAKEFKICVTTARKYYKSMTDIPFNVMKFRGDTLGSANAESWTILPFKKSVK